ncbi:hypothetical protein [Allonocardiopsis opalescens]|uniref:Biotin transporter BioY n=1 Tax=Allonocardiopsis opalescens TaxID=1144618 RepID=A0A2T0QA38_9ACTN|nr:hypothetical protein [Allonocardiopsis opalescens]PRY00724.1 biotin transporter BioY [Allonocardiopsis opalescens]
METRHPRSARPAAPRPPSRRRLPRLLATLSVLLVGLAVGGAAVYLSFAAILALVVRGGVPAQQAFLYPSLGYALLAAFFIGVLALNARHWVLVLATELLFYALLVLLLAATVYGAAPAGIVRPDLATGLAAIPWLAFGLVSWLLFTLVRAPDDDERAEPPAGHADRPEYTDAPEQAGPADTTVPLAPVRALPEPPALSEQRPEPGPEPDARPAAAAASGAPAEADGPEAPPPGPPRPGEPEPAGAPEPEPDREPAVSAVSAANATTTTGRFRRPEPEPVTEPAPEPEAPGEPAAAPSLARVPVRHRDVRRHTLPRLPQRTPGTTGHHPRTPVDEPAPLAAPAPARGGEAAARSRGYDDEGAVPDPQPDDPSGDESHAVPTEPPMGRVRSGPVPPGG